MATKRGKKYEQAREAVQGDDEPFPSEEAFRRVKEFAYADFDETIEVAVRLGRDLTAEGASWDAGKVRRAIDALPEQQRDVAAALVEQGVDSQPRSADPEERPVRLYLEVGVGRFLGFHDTRHEVHQCLLFGQAASRLGRNEDGEAVGVPLHRQQQRGELNPVAQPGAAVGEGILAGQIDG